MSNNPKLKDMGEHAKQLLGLIEECKPGADLKFLSESIKQWRHDLNKIPTSKRTYTGLFIHDNQTVTDQKTGLMWKRECQSGKYIYDEAIERFKGNNLFAGYNDWRLPTIDELQTLLLKNSPYIDIEAFPNNPYNILATSPWVGYSSGARCVYFCDDYILSQLQRGYDAVRLVRSIKE